MKARKNKVKKVKIGIVGLGRLGIKHAENIAFKVPNAELTAVCSTVEEEVQNAQKSWGIKYGYTDYKAMLENKELDAIFIASPSGLHCEQIEQALDAGFHVFSEKPLGVTVEECKRAEKAVERNTDKIFMLGFMRRFDPSYRYAKEKIDEGAIGKPIMFRGYSVDPESCIEGSIRFAAISGGQFIDMAIHDIDLARWFLNSEAKSIFAVGGCYAYPQFAEHNDGDTVAALMQFENDTMAFLYAGKLAQHGYNVETEIMGTKGTIRIAAVPQKNLVEVIDTNGVRKECSQNFLERFEESFVIELQEFVNCILENRKPEITVYDGTKSTVIAYAATEAFRENKLVRL